MITNWKLTEDKASNLIAEYFAIYCEIGPERFHQAVKAILHSEYQYFPTISEFRGYIPPKGKKTFCDKCESSGWIRVPDPVAQKLYKNESATAMVRCECRRKSA